MRGEMVQKEKNGPKSPKKWFFLQSNAGFKLLWVCQGLTNIKRMFGSSLLKSSNIESTNPKIEDCNRDGVHGLKGEKLMALLIVFEYM